MDPRLKFRKLKPIRPDQVSKTLEEFRLKSRDIERKLANITETQQKMHESELLSRLVGIWREEFNLQRKNDRELRSSLCDPGYNWIYADPEVAGLLSALEHEDQHFENTIIKPICKIKLVQVYAL